MLSLTPEEQPLVEKLMPAGGTLGAVALQLQPWSSSTKGVVLALSADGVPCDLWLPATVWRDWCEKVLGTADATQIAAPLLASIAAWGLTPLLTAGGLTLSSWTSPRPCNGLERQLAVTFRWQVEQQTFQGVLIGLPACVSRRFAAGVTPLTRTDGPALSLRGTLIIGVQFLTLAALRQLGPGAGLRLQSAGCPRTGKYTLILPGGSAVGITWKGGDTMEIDALMQDIAAQLEYDAPGDATRPGAPPAATADSGGRAAITDDVNRTTLLLNALPQQVRVDVGELSLTVGDLRRLAVGDVVPVTGRFTPYAILRLHNQTIGQGELVSCDGALLVRITRWYLTEAQADQAKTG
ncbi:type III secretion system protein SsaQ [Sodalis glossinidius str. 'morsitans']|uniref:Type III secretion apparatus n=1 Tax=Sodalis glossinidius (strain morsitans) TaxID=343509 RepID=Q2NTE6_SODGM|nr:YscQ/HrcQ family type III secretion apparatus protein [Sodalis glossinidius]BAE74579.1 putative type III secretion apparatus [Sodalis glossinidius str. 'morsitans']CRL45300.1 type III secretion system protein SsaQ [Sodalis glossinidius str. 'morsitans']